MFASIVNALAIILAGILGILLGQRFPERMQESLMKVCGLSVIFIGIDGAIKGLAKNDDFLFVIISLALGTLIGEWIDIDRRFETLGEYLKKKTGSQKDGGFTDAFVTASFTVCIGAMAVVGSLEAGLSHNFSILYTKSILDFVIILVSAIVFGNLEVALYAAIADVICSILLDRIIYGSDEAKLLLIISEQHEPIAARLMAEVDTGVPYLSGSGGYTGENKKVLMCALHKSDFTRAREIVREVDPEAFLIVSSASEVFGEGYKGHYSEDL